MKCVNCGTEATNTYCGNCGQRMTVKRLSLTEGFSDFTARIYGFDGMFPRTLRDLTLHPGEASRRYIEGNRAAYYGPVGYFFLMITLLYLVASLLGIDIKEFLKHGADIGLQPAPKQGSGQEKYMQSVYSLMSDNLKLVSFAVIPVQAFSSRFLFFRKSGLNFIEHAVMPLYVLGHLYWLSIMSVFCYALVGSFFPNWLQVSITILFFSYAYADLFQYQSKVKAFFKGLGVYLTTQILFGLIIAIVVFLMILLNPEVFEMLKPSNNR
jgi:hypothetical protein